MLVPVTPYPTSLGWAPHPDESEEWSCTFDAFTIPFGRIQKSLLIILHIPLTPIAIFSKVRYLLPLLFGFLLHNRSVLYLLGSPQSRSRNQNHPRFRKAQSRQMYLTVVEARM